MKKAVLFRIFSNSGGFVFLSGQRKMPLLLLVEKNLPECQMRTGRQYFCMSGSLRFSGRNVERNDMVGLQKRSWFYFDVFGTIFFQEVGEVVIESKQPDF